MDKKLTLRDDYQIASHEHEEQFDAKRVYIVGGEMPEIKIPDIKLPELDLSNIKFPEFEIKTIQVPEIIIQKEVQLEQVPTIVKEIEIKEIEKPVIIIQKEVQIEKIEVPVIVKEYETISIPEKESQIQYKETLPKWAIALLLLQSLIITLSLLTKIRI